MSDYTPTTEMMRLHLCSMAHLVGRVEGDGEMFDAWLAGVKAEVWDEGYSAHRDDVAWVAQGVKGETANPYRSET